MRPPILLVLAVAAAALPALLRAQEGGGARSESGFPILETRQLLGVTEGAETQTFDLTIDSAGRLVIGNLGGVLIHDGAWWRLVPVGQAHAAFSVAAGKNGDIGVGGVDDLGIVSQPMDRPATYRSLLELLPPDQRDLGQVHTVRPYGNGFLFHAENWLLFWDGARFHTLEDLRQATETVVSTQQAAGQLFIWTREGGLHTFDGKGYRPIPGGDVFRDRRVDMVAPAGQGLLVSVRGEGLFHFRGGEVEPIENAASEWLRTNRALSSTRLTDGRIAVGSVLGGLVILQSDGTIDQIINTDLGLPDDLVTGTAVDRDGTLWVTVNEGLVRVETSAGLSILDSRNGLKGSTYALRRHLGELWVGTSAGTYTTHGVEAAVGEPLRFRKVDEVPDSAWSFLSVGPELLIGTDMAIYSIRGDTTTELDVLENEVAYTMVRSKLDPTRVYLGLDDGLAVMRRDGGSWRLEGEVEGVRGDVRTIIEQSDGTIWGGTSFSGHYRIILPPGTPPSGAEVESFPAPEGDETYLYAIGDRILATRGKTIYALDTGSGDLVPERDLNRLGIHEELSVLAVDSSGDVWMNTHPPAEATRSGGKWTGLRVLHAVPPASIEVVRTEPDGTVWFGTGSGLIRYTGHSDADRTSLPAPRLTIRSGSELLSRGSDEEPVTLEPSTRRLRVELSPLSLRSGLRYQTRLLPVEDEWSAPSSEPSIELTSLAPGDYELEARTLTPGGGASPVATWSFTILPPWYRTWWAIALWSALALLLAHAYARHRSRLTAKRAQSLEHRVASQTHELQRSVHELEFAKSELENANRRLEQLTIRDDLTLLANRRHFLARLTEEWRRAHRHQAPLAVILLDLDHFKQVNDSLGHLEGDRCLQEMGTLLAAMVKRSGEVVARYGGEEFAILLPNTTVEEAAAFAEKLRKGVEELGINAGTAPGRVVTASLGVSGASSGAFSDPDKLLSQADQALYQAKREGRNQVRVFEPKDLHVA